MGKTIEEQFGKEFKDGMKAGLKIAQDVALKQGYKITFPDIETLRVEEVKDEKEKTKV